MINAKSAISEGAQTVYKTSAGWGSQTNSTVVMGSPVISPELFVALLRVSQLERLEAGWDGAGSVAPSVETIATAKRFIKGLFCDKTLSALCQAPFIAADCSTGEISFEWWCDDRKLTIFVASRDLTYLKSWGPDIYEEMEDGSISSGNLLEHLTWLANG